MYWRIPILAAAIVVHAAAQEPAIDNLAVRARTLFDAVPHAAGANQADAQRPALQRQLRHSLGHKQLPWPPDLQAHVTGGVERTGYRIEKIVYQSLPGSPVSAHLYLPAKLNGPAPAILFYNGHWFPDSKSRPDFQAFCINMARLGFVVLNYDTFGQGERGLSSRDHRRTEGLLVGVSQQGYAEYETQCALEYLLTRAEVDPQRIGMTGASGGGFNAWMTGALEDRVKVVATAVGTTDLYEQMMVRLPRDWDAGDHCHYVPGLFRYANNHELLTMVAPKPLLVLSATDDGSFPVSGARAVAAFGRRLYESYGKPERFAYFEDSTAGHGYQQKKREAAYGWFLRWLMRQGDGKPYAEPDTQTEPFDSQELHCFPDGRGRPAGPAMVEAAVRLANNLPPSHTKIDLAAVLGRWPQPVASNVKVQNAREQRLTIATERGIDVPVLLLRPAQSEKGLLVAMDDRGKQALAPDELVRDALAAGWAVAAVDARGIGELAMSKKHWPFAASLLMGENFVWRQTWDLVRTAQVLHATPAFRGKRLALYGRGDNSALAATYMAGSNAVDLSWCILRDGFLSFRQFLERPESLRVSFTLQTDDAMRRDPLDREIPFAYFPFDVLHHFDLPQVFAASKARQLVIHPIDGDWRRMTGAGARALLPASIAVVSASDPEAARSAYKPLLHAAK